MVISFKKKKGWRAQQPRMGIDKSNENSTSNCESKISIPGLGNVGYCFVIGSGGNYCPMSMRERWEVSSK
jgi:hypothetical protein